jgi:hypothetical protein
MPFHMWKLFHMTMAGTRQPKDQPMPLKLRVHNQEILTPWAPLDAYIQPLKSPKFDFIVHLTIAGKARFSSSELARLLPQLMNLGVLEIIQPRDEDQEQSFPRVTDSMVREWSKIPGIFPCLRVLRIWGDGFATIRSVKDAIRFPSLVVYDLAGREDDIDFRRHKGVHWTFSNASNWKHYRGWATGTDCDPKQHPFNCCGEKSQCKWMFTTKAWDTDTYAKSESVKSQYKITCSPQNNPVSMLLNALLAEDQARRTVGMVTQEDCMWNVYVGRFNHILRCAMECGGNQPVNFVPDHRVTQSLGFHIPHNQEDAFELDIPFFHTSTLYYTYPDRSLYFGSWGLILYSQIGKLWRDGDLRAQDRPIYKMATLWDKSRLLEHEFGYILPTRPYASVSLGQLDRLYCPDPERLKTYVPTGTMEAHVTFLRVNEPPYGGDASNTTTKEVPKGASKKRAAHEESKSQHASSQSKRRQRTISDLLSQFM